MRADSGSSEAMCFVSENDLRLLHQRAGNRHTLLLAAGECGNTLMGKVHHANAGQRL